MNYQWGGGANSYSIRLLDIITLLNKSKITLLYNKINSFKSVFPEHKKQTAFTLAEVLITIGIIGVVAAMTLPTLIGNYQRKIWAVQLKQTVSIVSQGLKQIAAENGGLRSTPFGQSVPIILSDGTKRGMSATYNDSFMYPFITQYAKKTWDIQRVACFTIYDRACPNIKLTKDYRIKILEPVSTGNDYYSTNGSSGFRLKNGATVVFYADRDRNCGPTPFADKSQMKTSCGRVVIDINGDKYPNTIGYDLFRFAFDNEGNLWPFGGQELSKAMSGSNTAPYGNLSMPYWKINQIQCCTKKTDNCQYSEGWGCAGRVVEDNWQINY